MKERPIIFSGGMVRAILDGRKTQTRRIVKPQPPHNYLDDGEKNYAQIHHKNWLKCPYGQPGDRLWVRETFNTDWCSHPIYKADGGSAIDAGYASEPKWRPSIYMPRWASRINLLVKDVRVERVQDITENDARREGCVKSNLSMSIGIDGDPTYRKNFERLWNSINEKRGYGWDVNPWVWVVEFEKERTK